MEPDDWMEVNVSLGSEPQDWVGRGYWPLPSTSQGWTCLVDVVSRAIMGSIPGLQLTPYRYEMTLKARVVTLPKAVSLRVRSRYNRHASDDPRQLLWLPVIKQEERWGVTDG